MKEIFNKFMNTDIIVSVLVILFSIGLLIAVRVISRKFRKSSKREGETATVVSVLLRVVEFLILVGALLSILQINGVNISSMIAGLGIASAIVGLALQDFLKDIIMGLHIMSDRFFSVGDCVEYMGREGTVLSFTLTSTKIGDLDDHSVITVSNRNISEIRRIANRMDIDIPISYNDKPQKVSEVLISVCDKIALDGAVEKCIYKGTEKFERSDVLHRIRIICEPKQRSEVRRLALGVIQQSLDEAGIMIPYDQLDIHIDRNKE